MRSTTNKTDFQRDDFSNPGPEWRGKPFWSWNGKLERDELIRQIHVMKEMGMGGFFMHSRVGLATEYLGKEWFELTNDCAEEALRRGMESWLYDEDRWPSGTAGGAVTENPEYRMKFIHMTRFEGAEFDLAAWREEQDKPLGAWSCRVEDKINIFEVEPVNHAPPCDELKGKEVLAFAVVPMPTSGFYNGNTYVDTMKREATDEYIRLTHEAYKEHCGHHFGKAIRGIFTDEPHRGAFMTGFGGCSIGPDLFDYVPWTEAIFDAVEETCGVRVAERLPALFLREDGEAVSQIKAQYAETMLRLFLDNFAKPYYDWCEENGLQVTGHVLHEDSLSCQVSTNGSVQRYYPLMHVPGIDYLCEHGRGYWVAKQVDSVARQFDQPWVLSELYGCTGWQMNFESHKAIGAWQALFGVNLRCHHLSWYTMAGQAKRDYPASILHQSPWYREYNTVETWFARLGYFRAQGSPCCDLLVLNPVESVWGRVYPGAIQGMGAHDDAIRALEKKYEALFHILAGNQIDFDYGDEALMAESARVVTVDDTPMIRFGAMDYTTLLISGVETIRSTTLTLLDAFVEAGGRVVFAGDAPSYVDSLESAAACQLATHATICEFEESAIIDALDGHTSVRVRIVDAMTGDTASEVFCQPREDKSAFYLTVLNTSRDDTKEVSVSVVGIAGSVVEEWDLDTGDALRLARETRDPLNFRTTLSTSQARCFRIVSESELPCSACVAEPLANEVITLDQPASYTLAAKNICVLDTPSWSLNRGELRPVNDILQIDRLVRNELDVPIRGGDMLQPWFRGKDAFPDLGELSLVYAVDVEADALPALDEAQLVLETPDAFRVSVNGIQLDATDCGWWVDVALRRIGLPAGLFREGRNEIAVNCTFREDLNLEAMYLLGNFAVSLKGPTPMLTTQPVVVLPGTIAEQGFPYYSDNIVYHYDVPKALVGETTTVSVPSYEGAYVKASSGLNARMIPWRPNEARLTLGTRLDIEVCITRKNTFGPLHSKNPRPGGTGPHSFVPGTQQFSLEPVFIESGLLEPVRLAYGGLVTC